MFSVRVSNHRTGRPARRASSANSSSSGVEPALAPKLPPTSGHTTRTVAGSNSYIWARASRTGWAPWQLWYWVSRPSSPHQANPVRPSIGLGATRWLTIRWLTTTSQPEKSAVRLRASMRHTTLDSASSKRTVPPSSDDSGSTTAGSGS